MSQETKKGKHKLVQEITNLLFLLLAAVNRHGPLVLRFLLQKETLGPEKTSHKYHWERGNLSVKYLLGHYLQ